MKRLSNRQEQILSLIWNQGPLTVQQIKGQLPDILHFNTISTVLRELERAGFIKHIDKSKPFQYYSVISKTDYIVSVIETFTERFFAGNKSEMIRTLTANHT